LDVPTANPAAVNPKIGGAAKAVTTMAAPTVATPTAAWISVI
jgi:hypothetical protein